MEDKIKIKQALYNACQHHVEERIKTIEDRLRVIEESRNNETKSSVGDKYETGRAMMQMEEEKSKVQLFEAVALRQTLKQVDPNKKLEKAELGSLVETNRGSYYFCIGIGKVKQNNKTFYCISMDSPIGQVLRGRRTGESITFNNSTLQIKAIN